VRPIRSSGCFAGRRFWGALVYFAIHLGSAVCGQAEAEPDSVTEGQGKFSVFDNSETHVLSNGLRVWIQPIPNAQNIAVGITLPFGRDADPVGLEQTAHFVEHMLLKGHMGRTELEVEREVSDRGGSKNGLTYADHSAYYVLLPVEHSDFAIEWLWKILSPHAMDPEVVEAERDPIALEIGARRRNFIDTVRAWYMTPTWLRTPQFWKREFGIEGFVDRDYDPWRSLHAIQPEDLSAFYDKYYVPSLMRLSISGDVDPAHVMEVVERTFGTLESKPEPEPVYQFEDPKRRFSAFGWQRRESVWYRNIYKLYDPSLEDVIAADFVSRFLNKRLLELLRRGDDKAVYSLSVGPDNMGPVTGFQIQAEIRADLFEVSRATIEAEVEALRGGTHEPELFNSIRSTMAKQVRTGVTEPADLLNLHLNTFYHSRIYEDLPNIPKELEQVTQARIAEFVSRCFVPERQVFDVIHPKPLSQMTIWALEAALLGAIYKLARWLLVKRIDMRQIVYVARLQVSFLYALIAGGLVVALMACIARLGYWAWLRAFALWVRPIDDYNIQLGARAVGALICILLVIGILSRLPRKLLLLQDELRIKGLLFRSRVLQPEDIVAIELRGFREIWLTKRLRSTLPLTLGLFKRRIYLQVRSGRSYFFRVRDQAEVLALLRDFAPDARTETYGVRLDLSCN
jgi:predicted Zn-dependent peptidase